jgi:hypothetical protein
MKCPTHNGFVNIDVAIPDFKVEAAIRIGTNPGFVVNRRPLTAEIGQGHQVSRLAPLTLGEIKLFHEVHLPTKIEFLAVYTMPELLTRVSLTRLSLSCCK